MIVTPYMVSLIGIGIVGLVVFYIAKQMRQPK